MKIVVLAGGVGGAKLVDGLSKIISPSDLTVVVNTGDDFIHYGLSISPDLDTITYTLAGLANPTTGWGCHDDTYNMIASLKQLGGETWFLLGDKDLALHMERTRLLHKGYSLSWVTSHFCRALGINQIILPMSDNPVRTIINTDDDRKLSFQEYFVKEKFIPRIKRIHFSGIKKALAAPGVLEAIDRAEGIIFSPSNPWISIDPILRINSITASIRRKKILAVSPIISGHALKGPAAKIFLEMGIQPSCVSVYQHYSQLLSGFVIDKHDTVLSHEIPIPTLITNTIMKTSQDRAGLARCMVDFLLTL